MLTNNSYMKLSLLTELDSYENKYLTSIDADSGMVKTF